MAIDLSQKSRRFALGRKNETCVSNVDFFSGSCLIVDFVMNVTDICHFLNYYLNVKFKILEFR